MQLVNLDKVKQVIHMCFDLSYSIGPILQASIANWTHGHRLSSVQGLIAFNNQIIVKCELSPLLPYFDNASLGLAEEGHR
jgi:hypothetical protein